MKLIFILTVLLNFEASADLQKLRWTAADQKKPDLISVVGEISKQTQLSLKPEDFKLNEQKNLNGMNYHSYAQVIAGQVVKDAGIRIWESALDGSMLQMIAWIQNPQSSGMRMAIQQLSQFNFIPHADISFTDAARLALPDLLQIRNFHSTTQWVNEKLVLVIQIYGKDRSLEIHLDPDSRQLLLRKVRLYPREDIPSTRNRDDEYSVKGKAFKVNEEFESAFGRRFSEAAPEVVELKYLKKEFKGSAANWIDQLPQKKFEKMMMDPVKAATPEGLAAGYWSRDSLTQLIDRATAVLPLQKNLVESGARFVGRYVQVAIYPEAFNKFAVTTFQPFYSDFVNQTYQETGPDNWSITLSAGILGKPFYSESELLNRRAPYEIKRDTTAMINEGFDEMQVYWSVTSWFELMHQAGFTDVELSTRPIRAFLFDPTIDVQDNAFYDSDTINFSTYTERNGNEARNLITVWHELGHGLMDRLQGAAGFDNGGLSEGTADFAAEMVLRGFYRLDIPAAIAGRRINNQIGFELTNEAHDSGEAYGGSLKDLLEQKIQTEGFSSYAKTCDLVLDAMRLTRGSPNLSATDWYEALLLADQIGKAGLRIPGEYASLLAQVFQNRNFFYLSNKGAALHLFYDDKEVLSSGLGSRNSPLPISIAEGNTANYVLKVKVSVTDNPNYTYPLKIVVAFKETNALQGALKFRDEENQSYTLNSADEIAEIPVGVLGGCEFKNTNEGFCKDFVNVQVFTKNQSEPFAKKRFYFENKF